jgi:sugar phosphate isomerase/epimerase
MSTMKLGFSTLGCPEWGLEEIVRFGREYGYATVGLRGVQGELDLVKVPEFQPAQRAATRVRLQEAGLPPEILLTSTRLVRASEAERAAGLQSAMEHIDLARDLGVPFIRVFGGPRPEGVSHEQACEWTVSGLRTLGDYASSRGVMPLLETHDYFCDTGLMSEVMEAAAHPSVGVLWDIHHPFRVAGEPIAESWRNIAKWVRFCDVKDSKIDSSARLGYRYVLIGEGDVPVGEALELLRAGGYTGCLSFEWEKIWHPDLADAHIAFPDYVRKMRQLLGSSVD